MDHIDRVFATATIQEVQLSAPIRASLLVAKKTLNRYYSLTDESHLYRIAMGMSSPLLHLTSFLKDITVLHPRYKLDYFIDANWEASWIADARKLVRDEFDRKYKRLMVDIVVVEDGQKDSNMVRALLLFYLALSHSVLQSLASDNVFDNLNTLKKAKRTDLRDDLERYLSTDTEVTNDPLMWWKEKESMYPCLSRMALDYLSIPGMLYSPFPHAIADN